MTQNIAPEPCFSRGPRIGEEGKPVCLEPDGHPGLHRGYEGSGFERERWGLWQDRDMTLVREWRAANA